MVAIEVGDNGPGFRMEILEALRLSEVESTKEGHFGVGLLMTKGFVEACGGMLEFGKSKLGGALVRILLPFSEGEEERHG